MCLSKDKIMSNAKNTVSVDLGGSSARDLIASERAEWDAVIAPHEAFLAAPTAREARRSADLAMLDEAFGNEDES
jgi:hypothetical protein